MITLELIGVDIGFAEKDGGIVLAFIDQKSGIQTVIPFDAGSWETFKRHVAADGKVPRIVQARIVPEDGGLKNGQGGM